MVGEPEEEIPWLEIGNLTFGIIIICANMVCYIPQISKIVMKQSVKGMSFGTFYMCTLATYLNWLSMLILNFNIITNPGEKLLSVLHSWVSITNIGVTFVALFLIISLYFYYYLKENDPRGILKTQIQQQPQRIVELASDDNSGSIPQEPEILEEFVKVDVDESGEVTFNEANTHSPNSPPNEGNKGILEHIEEEATESNEDEDEDQYPLLTPGESSLEHQDIKTSGSRTGGGAKGAGATEGDGNPVLSKPTRKQKVQTILVIVGYFSFIYILITTMFFFVIQFPVFGLRLGEQTLYYYAQVIGYISTGLIFVTYIPQIVTTFFHGKAGALSLITLCIVDLGSFLNMIYFIAAGQWFANWSNSLAGFIQLSIIIGEIMFFKCRQYLKEKRMESQEK